MTTEEAAALYPLPPNPSSLPLGPSSAWTTTSSSSSEKKEGVSSSFSSRSQKMPDSTWHYYYYLSCWWGGAAASSIRWIQTPLDVIKCNMQVHPRAYPTMLAAGQSIYRQEGWAGLYRGLHPTVLAYTLQAGTKYSLYEYLKDSLLLGVVTVGPEHHSSSSSGSRTAIYLVSAALAEGVACILMCPWEVIKVRMQTASASPALSLAAMSSSVAPTATAAFPRQVGAAWQVMMNQQSSVRFPWDLQRTLGPLWCRQVPGTMINMMVFEHAVTALYRHVWNQKPKAEYPLSTQLGITLMAGYTAGVCSSMVSHPADSLLSLSQQPRFAHQAWSEVIRQVGGWRTLATRGLLPRMIMTGSVLSGQWLLYDTFKSTVLGLETTGG